MALIEGSRLFGARLSSSPGTPQALPYGQAPADTVIIKGGHPVVLASGTTGGDTIQRATLSGTGSVTNSIVPGAIVTNAKLLGFAAGDTYAADAADYGTFGIALNKTFVPNANGKPTLYELVNVFVADTATTFSMCIRSGQTVTQTLVGQTAGFFLETAPDQIVLDPTLSANEIATITAINPNDEGKLGGRVDFQLLSTARQFPAA